MTLIAQANPLKAEDYRTLPLELMSVTDLTDALGVDESAKLLGTSRRAIYTVRNTNGLGVERTLALINAVRQDEATFRQKLVVLRNAQAIRQSKQ